MKSKEAEAEKDDDANTINIRDSAPGAGMVGQWWRRARWPAALAALLGAALLLAYVRAQHLRARRLDRLLDLERYSEELLKNLEILDHHMSMRLDQLAAMHRL